MIEYRSVGVLPHGVRDALPRDLDDALVALYRGWDRLERRLDGSEVIDFDLAPRGEPRRMTRREAVLEGLREAESRVVALPPTAARDLVLARLTSSWTYLQALLGKSYEFGDYIQRTLGIEPRLFPEEAIQEQANRVDERLREYGVRRSGPDSLRYEPEHFNRFQRFFFIRTPELLPRQFDFYRSKWLPVLLDRLDIDLEPYDIDVQFAEQDAYWKNWISGDLERRRIELRINLHRRHTWYQGSPEILVLHEYCGHAVQMASWHREIHEGRLPSFLGILTVHFPDQFLLEGLAESLPHFVPDRGGTSLQLEAMSSILRELHYHTLLVMNNFHILANRDSATAAIGYARNRLPFSSLDTLEREARDRTANPLFRTYQYVYGIAKRTFLETLFRLESGAAWRMLEQVYTCPMTPEQFSERAAQR